MSADLKARLAKIDPATLEAGPETDKLIGEILGLFNAGLIGKPQFVLAYSRFPGHAFQDCWPWLQSHCVAARIAYGHGSSNFVGGRVELWGDFGLTLRWHEFDARGEAWALALCRAVVAVAKEYR